ncbi:uncharacterized protein B0P05DRAFT_576022 [Gilbertella persicaria]|uniref:uncharacterized protein n=1 Tax=Gilbertella persicaria TaxID=101096 RepID=UPI00221F23FD|nr:uncharacterized protein B0P05DRAFT_576022 [Gilbertella persicaria]KAI8048616.1 hypothetical protein B0P05DRAFT_576022 [Gilbertella persicaria]
MHFSLFTTVAFVTFLVLGIQAAAITKSVGQVSKGKQAKPTSEVEHKKKQPKGSSTQHTNSSDSSSVFVSRPSFTPKKPASFRTCTAAVNELQTQFDRLDEASFHINLNSTPFFNAISAVEGVVRSARRVCCVPDDRRRGNKDENEDKVETMERTTEQIEKSLSYAPLAPSEYDNAFFLVPRLRSSLHELKDCIN